MRTLILLAAAICLSGCFTKTRTMQEATKLDVVADTPVGQIHVRGNINRNQNEQTELKVEVPEGLKNLAGSAASYLPAGGGILGLVYALYATRKRKREVQEKEEEKVKLAEKHLEQQKHYLHEICRGVGLFLARADADDVAELKRCLKESMSHDTRNAVREFT